MRDFEEFLQEYFETFRTNLREVFETESILFDDPGKQDEYYFIIAHPVEYVIGKCRDYRTSKLDSCEMREAVDRFAHMRCYLEDRGSCDNVQRNYSYEAI